jgi:protein-S-isoprenylcysteine O-methyltransferase Ste14
MRKDHPGVHIPPPLIYVAFFFFSVFLQKQWPFSSAPFSTAWAPVIGWLLIALGGLVIFPALQRFLVSKNTLITVKPAHSLQTTGIYAYTRNPMYMGLLLLYGGIAFFQGNWWTFIVAPLLILVVQLYIVKKEEDYLQRAFGEEYHLYKRRVRAWI